MAEEVRHYQVNGKHRIVFEKAASANRIDGFKVEANSDELQEAMQQAETLYIWAISKVEANKPILLPVKEK